MFLMRDQKEERKKQARSNKQTRQNNVHVHVHVYTSKADSASVLEVHWMELESVTTMFLGHALAYQFSH